MPLEICVWALVVASFLLADFVFVSLLLWLAIMVVLFMVLLPSSVFKVASIGSAALPLFSKPFRNDYSES